MADQHYHTEYREQPRSSGGAIAFIVGGLVVAVGIVLYLVFGDFSGATGSATAPAGDSIEINTSADSATAGAADDGAAAESAATADTADDAASATAGAESGDAAATAGADAQN